MNKFFSSKNNSYFLILFGAIFLVTLPLFQPGFFSIHDETHITDLYQMLRSLSLGGFPPRWAPDFNFSLGYPYFNFYYHLPFYISTIAFYLGFSFYQSFKAVMFISVLLAGIGFYLFAKRYLSEKAALVAAVGYIFTPYFAVDLYVRGALGELMVLGSILYKQIYKH